MEYRKMKSGLVKSCSALATALLAFSIVFGASRALAEDLDATSRLPPTVVAENSAEITEVLEVTCLASRTDAQTLEGSCPLAVERQAILIEVAQSVTVAVLGQDVAERETDIAGFASSIVAAAAPAITPQSSAVILDPEE
jgi:hypothetical protein